MLSASGLQERAGPYEETLHVEVRSSYLATLQPVQVVGVLHLTFGSSQASCQDLHNIPRTSPSPVQNTTIHVQYEIETQTIDVQYKTIKHTSYFQYIHICSSILI